MRLFSTPLFASTAVFLSLVAQSWATLERIQGMQFMVELAAKVDAVSRVDASNSTAAGAATFDQPIDHSNPSLGTFKQRYWYNTTYWKGPGSPVSYLFFFLLCSFFFSTFFFPHGMSPVRSFSKRIFLGGEKKVLLILARALRLCCPPLARLRPMTFSKSI